MFNLEQAITDWRKQMLAAGIKMPVPLEELENHLREEIEREMNSGLSEPDALKNAAQKIGQADLLKMEFAKTAGFWNRVGSNEFVKIMKRKTGLSLVVAALLITVTLQFASAPLIARMHTVSHQDGHTMVDNFWQIQWYAFGLAGLFIIGVILAALPKPRISKLADK